MCVGFSLCSLAAALLLFNIVFYFLLYSSFLLRIPFRTNLANLFQVVIVACLLTCIFLSILVFSLSLHRLLLDFIFLVFPSLVSALLVALVCGGRLGSYAKMGPGARIEGGKWVKGASRLRIGSWNIGSLMETSIELVKILKIGRLI